MENTSLVVEFWSFLTCAESAEVFSGLGYVFGEQLKDDAASLRLLTLLTTDLDIEEDLRVRGFESW